MDASGLPEEDSAYLQGRAQACSSADLLPAPKAAQRRGALPSPSFDSSMAAVDALVVRVECLLVQASWAGRQRRR